MHDAPPNSGTLFRYAACDEIALSAIRERFAKDPIVREHVMGRLKRYVVALDDDDPRLHDLDAFRELVEAWSTVYAARHPPLAKGYAPAMEVRKPTARGLLYRIVAWLLRRLSK